MSKDKQTCGARLPAAQDAELCSSMIQKRGYTIIDLDTSILIWGCLPREILSEDKQVSGRHLPEAQDEELCS